MAQKCRFCAGLTISHLIELAKEEFTGHTFPDNAYYQHHACFADLEQSAEDGCGLCQLILDCFKGAEREDYEWPRTWAGAEADNDWSMYSAAKEMDMSDVKIAIDASQTFGADPLELVSVFDTILVQVGMSQDAPADPDDEDVWSDRFPTLRLTLSRPACGELRIDGFQVGRVQVDQGVASQYSRDTARAWLEECRSSHPDCLSNGLPELPTRVVDVGTGSNPQTPRVLYTNRGLRANYIALSHCWGGGIAHPLTTKSLEQFRTALPYDDLPASFRDAISISRELGIRYLWIDSLCIIQDSKEDWENESMTMAAVYGNSTLTISAIAASGSNVGILVPGPPPPIPTPSSLRVYPGADALEEVRVERQDLEEENLSLLFMRGPLSVRGWTLQESILSPRHLFYGVRQIYWKCPSHYRSADGTCARFNAPQTSYDNISRVLYAERFRHQISNDLADRESLLLEYYDLVEEYSNRNLTFASDKLPAFSGLAHRLHSLLGGEYLAGLWSSDVKRGLLWFTDRRFCRHVKDYRSPSWSWAATDDAILFNARVASYLPSSAEMKLSDYRVVPRSGGELFGEIESGYLVVEGLMLRLFRSMQVHGALVGDDSDAGNVFWDAPDRGDVPDDSGYKNIIQVTDGTSAYLLSLSLPLPRREAELQIDRTAISEDLYFLFLVHADDNDTQDDSVSSAKCIVIRPVANGIENTFERVGRATIFELSSGWRAPWENRVLTLL
ncbi:heterokaryon incompatibility protein-domain-containing protein [Lasiosphaeria hispida]|uniref:Heterokaryon incompatibility protein-domain-containing protein n=1 Tax=Lasiosphaeria hispida TaxID=260671 RepID=A0AAJ0HJB0_9PEZI|nr:heterokaryon incompatibility protein-domain-containing protein [Lasiosphaeria hispida]